MVFDSLQYVLAHSFVGAFSADSAAISAVYAFVDSSAPLADRAAALRFLAADAFGFDGADAGEGVPDADFVQAYLDAR